MDKIFEAIKTERQKQDDKFGIQNHNPMEWVAILSEELGEVSKEALEYYFTINGKMNNGLNSNEKIEFQNNKLKLYRKELIQLAAVAVNMIESLDRNELKKK